MRRNRLARTAKRGVPVPAKQLREASATLRKIASDDPHAIALCNAFDSVDGMLRVGRPNEPKRQPN